MWSKYITAFTVDEVLEVLAAQREKARLVAGATDLILEIELGVRKGIETVIDVTRIPDLDKIYKDSQDIIHVGPLATHNDCVAANLLRKFGLPLAQASWVVGAPQIRNRSTVAGNLITASPANDTIPALMVLGGSVVLRSTCGERKVLLTDFYVGLRKTVMQPDEMLIDIQFPALDPKTQRGAFMRMTLRRAQAISVVNTAIVLTFGSEKIKHAAVALGAVAPTVIRASKVETFLESRKLTAKNIEQAAELALKSATPIDDVRSSAAYRREMVKVAVSRVLTELAAKKQPVRIPAVPIMLAVPSETIARKLRRETALSRRSNPQGTSQTGLGIAMPPSAARNGAKIVTTINGKPYTFEIGQDKTLLRLLREDALLIGTKEGCAEGECGACTVFLDGRAVMSCLVPAPRAHGSEIVTIEGLMHNGNLHPVQKAFVDAAAVQCGYCTPGFLMSAAKLLEEKPHPTREQAQQAVAGNLCRCTGYYKILDAIEQAGKAKNRVKG